MKSDSAKERTTEKFAFKWNISRMRLKLLWATRINEYGKGYWSYWSLKRQEELKNLFHAPRPLSNFTSLQMSRLKKKIVVDRTLPASIPRTDNINISDSCCIQGNTSNNSTGHLNFSECAQRHLVNSSAEALSECTNRWNQRHMQWHRPER